MSNNQNACLKAETTINRVLTVTPVTRTSASIPVPTVNGSGVNSAAHADADADDDIAGPTNATLLPNGRRGDHNVVVGIVVASSLLVVFAIVLVGVKRQKLSHMIQGRGHNYMQVEQSWSRYSGVELPENDFELERIQPLDELGNVQSDLDDAPSNRIGPGQQQQVIEGCEADGGGHTWSEGQNVDPVQELIGPSPVRRWGTRGRAQTPLQGPRMHGSGIGRGTSMGFFAQQRKPLHDKATSPL